MTSTRFQLLAIAVCIAGLPASAAAQEPRATVGVAFGGGSARGIAHVGVIRWFEEHHIPIDVAAGTSMGGLIGGAFASGMSSVEIDEMLQRLNWDEMLGASAAAFSILLKGGNAFDAGVASLPSSWRARRVLTVRGGPTSV